MGAHHDTSKGRRASTACILATLTVAAVLAAAELALARPRYVLDSDTFKNGLSEVLQVVDDGYVFRHWI